MLISFENSTVHAFICSWLPSRFMYACRQWASTSIMELGMNLT